MKKIFDAIKWFFSEENNEGGLMPFLKGLAILVICFSMIVCSIVAISTGNFVTVCGIISLVASVFIFIKVMGWLSK